MNVLGPLGRKLGMGMVDNIFNMASNFPVPILIASSGDEAGKQLGAAAVSLLVYNLTSGLATAVGVETYTVLGNAEGDKSRRSMEPIALAGLMGLAGGALTLLILVLTSISTVASVLIAMAIPALVLERQFRLLGHVESEHARSARNSLLWLVVSAAVFVAWIIVGTITPAAVVISWLAGAAASLLFYFASWDLPRRLRLGRVSRQTLSTGGSLAFEFVVDRGALDVVALMLSAAYGSVFAGQLRLAQSVFGVSNLLVGSSRPTLLAESRRRLGAPRQATTRFMGLISLALAAIPAGVMLLVFVLGEARLESLFGAAGVGAFAFLPWLGLRRIGRNAALGPSIFLRVSGELRRSRRLRVASGLATLTIAGLASLFATPTVALAGLGAVSVVLAVAWWWAALTSTQLNRPPADAPEPDQSSS